MPCLSRPGRSPRRNGSTREQNDASFDKHGPLLSPCGVQKNENVRALARGLKILRYVNAVGEARAAEIAVHLDIPRPSVYRLLHTLEEEGYIYYSATDSRVRVTAQAAGLGDSYAATSMVCRTAGPILARYTSTFAWPIDLSFYENAHMVVQETTHAQSPLSIDRGMIGYRLPMLRSSAGRAYLGHCDSAERELIVKHVRRLDEADDRPFLEPGRLETMLAKVGKTGVATRGPGTFRPQTASIAVPVIARDRVAACISTIWVSGAMTMNEAIAQYAEPMREVAAGIAEAVEAVD